MADRLGIHVLRPGLLTTVQDLGRPGYQRYGVSVSGAMDRRALLIGNRLVGNPDEAAGLECTIQGPELRFEEAAVIAVTGGDLSPVLNGEAVPVWKAVEVQAGGVLAIGRRRSGARTYVAVAGGIDVPAVLGSRATHLRSRTGGAAGQPLTRGQTLDIGRRNRSPVIPRCAPPAIIPPYHTTPTLRLVRGPQFARLSPQAAATLTSRRFAIAPESDRMGYRLVGARIVIDSVTHTISDASPPGSVQVPPDGRPILLMADHQTTGGYPIVGVVCSLDLSLAAQLMPGDHLGFAFISPEAARTEILRSLAVMDEELPQIRSSPRSTP